MEPGYEAMGMEPGYEAMGMLSIAYCVTIGIGQCYHLHQCHVHPCPQRRDSEDDLTDEQSQRLKPVETQFCDWCCKYFANSLMRVSFGVVARLDLHDQLSVENLGQMAC